jgi:hypothetical protein
MKIILPDNKEIDVRGFCVNLVMKSGEVFTIWESGKEDIVVSVMSKKLLITPIQTTSIRLTSEW